MCENYISRDILNNYLVKYNWKVISQFTPNNNNLTDYYTWYSVVKYS